MRYMILLIVLFLVIGCTNSIIEETTNDLNEIPKKTSDTTQKEEELIKDFLINEDLSVEDCPNANVPENCYHQVAVQKKDYKVCEYIEHNRLLCYESVARELQDPSICDFYTKSKEEDEEDFIYELSLEADRKTCRTIVESIMVKDTNLEIKKGSIEECYNLLDQESMIAGQCYSTVATRELDHTICKNIHDQGQRNMCIVSIATAKKDKNICDDIDLEIQVEQCKLMIQ
jgi:hypothetical protein